MPLVAAAAITVGGSLLASNSASKAAKQSAQASQTATDQATAEQRRQYDQSRADYAPYLQTGTNALNALGRLYGLSGSSQPGAVTQAYPTGRAGSTAEYGPSYGLAGFGGGRPISTMDEFGRTQTDMPERIGYSGLGSIGTGQQGQAQQVPQTAAGQPTGQAGDLGTFWQSPDYNFRLSESMRALTARNAALGIQDSGAAQRSALTLAGNQASGEYNNYANRLAALAGVGQTTAQNNAALGQTYANNVGNLQTGNATNLASSYQKQGQAQSNLYGSLAGIGSGLIGQLYPVGK